ncbi:unnamed protein product [Arabidopsis arenosa]|uniref:Clp1 P-loop domain-containing protein n=2 Tax=Arabidopsis arenosa TaxID=38785 RepID=A0A8S1ZR88_ARAAE|nr:unnamed protein product [Arabidopsis arenosa]
MPVVNTDEVSRTTVFSSFFYGLNLNIIDTGRSFHMFLSFMNMIDDRVGHRDSGKSTSAKVLLNWAVKDGWKPTFVDLNIGQSSITIPGTVSATPIKMLVDPVEGFPLDKALVHYFGHTTPSLYASTRKGPFICRRNDMSNIVMPLYFSISLGDKSKADEELDEDEEVPRLDESDSDAMFFLRINHGTGSTCNTFHNRIASPNQSWHWLHMQHIPQQNSISCQLLKLTNQSKLGIGKEKALSITQAVQKYGNLSGFVERFSLRMRNPTAFFAGALLVIGFLLRELPMFALAAVANAVGVWTIFPYMVAASTALFLYIRSRYSSKN